MFLSSRRAVSSPHNTGAPSYSACRAGAGSLPTGCRPEPPPRSREGSRRCSEGWEKGLGGQGSGVRWHCENPVPVSVGMRGTMGLDLSIATASEISLFPSVFPPSAEATARERRFARVTLGPKQMERTCCEHFTKDGPDSCNMPLSPADGSVDHPAHGEYQGRRSWLTTAHAALEARLQ